MKKYLLVLLMTATLSCSQRSAFEYKLIESKWVMFVGKTLKEENDKWPNGYFIFREDGSANSVDIYSDEENIRMNEDGSIIHQPLLWSYKSGSKELILNDVKLKVLSIEGDTIHLLSDTTNIMLYNIDKAQAKLKKGPGMCLGG